MAIKLKYLFRDRRLALALKTLLFAGAIALLDIGAFHVVPALFFIAVSSVLYATSPSHQSFPLLSTFILLDAYVVIVLPILERVMPFHVWLLIFSLGFFFILGIKELVFVNRIKWHNLITLIFLYVLFLGFFLSEERISLAWRSIGFLWFICFLGRNFLKHNILEEKIRAKEKDQRINVGSGILTLVAAETVWLISFLPFTPLYSASMLVLIFFILSDLLVGYLKNEISRTRILAHVSILVLFAIILFAASGVSP